MALDLDELGQLDLDDLGELDLDELGADEPADEPTGLAAFGTQEPSAEDLARASSMLEPIIKAPVNVAKNVGRIASVLPAAITDATKGVGVHLSALDKVMHQGGGDMTPEEIEAFWKTDVPLATSVGTAVTTGGLGLAARTGLNAALPWAAKQIGRIAGGEESTTESRVNDAYSSIPQATAAAATYLPAWARIPLQVAAGETTRRLLGQETTVGGVALDTIDPALFSMARNTGEAFRRARTNRISDLPGREEALALENSLRPYGEQGPIQGMEGGPPRVSTPEVTPATEARGLFKGIFARDPISSGRRSQNPMQQELAKRLYHITDEGMRFEGRLRERAQEIRRAVEGLGDPHEVGYLTDYEPGRQDILGPLPAGAERPSFVGPPVREYYEAAAKPDVVDAAGLTTDTYRRLRSVGENIEGFFPPSAPAVEGYGGPLLLREDTAAGRARLRSQAHNAAERTETFGEALGPEQGYKHRLAPHQRDEAGWVPGVHAGDPRSRIDAWANMYVPAMEAAAGAGAKSTGSAAGTLRTIANTVDSQHVSSNYAEDLGYPREFPPDYPQASELLEAAATVKNASGSEELRAIADDFRYRSMLGHEATGEEIAAELRARAADLRANPRPDESKALGRYASDLAARARQGGLAGPEVQTQEKLEAGFKQLYNKEASAEGGWPRRFSLLARGVSSGLLGTAGIGQIAQSASNVFRPGFGRTWQGMVRRAIDPSMGDMMRRSGAGVSPFLAHHDSLTMEAPSVLGNQEDVIGRQMAAGEYWNRQVSNAGAVPYIEDTLAEQRAGVRSPAQTTKMWDMGLDPEGSGELDYGTMEDAFRRLTGEQQFLSTRAGFSPPAMIDSQTGRAVTQYMPYAMNQSRMVYDDILTPIGHGLRHPIRNRSELSEGLDRAARYVPAVGIATTVAKGVKDIATGDVFDPDKDWNEDYGVGLLKKMAENAGGWYGKVGLNLGEAIYRTMQGKGRVEDYARAVTGAVLPPSVSVFEHGSKGPVARTLLGTFGSAPAASALSVYGPGAAALGGLGMALAAPDDDQSYIERPEFEPQASR